MQLKNKTALVSGAGTGIGRAAALKLAAEGAFVWLCGRRAEPLKALQAVIEVRGGAAQACAADVADEASVAALARQVLEKGAPDILVNNAGLSREMPLADMPMAVWDELFAVNIRGAVLLTKAFLPAMQARRSGSIVNIGSGAALRGLPGSTAYSASKAALVCLSQALGDELRPHNIRVNAVCPGPVDTELFRGSERRDYILAAGGDVLEPEVVANAVFFLASEASRGVSSQVLTLRGFNRW